MSHPPTHNSDTMTAAESLRRIRHLYHFTDDRNLVSILEHGLCPLAVLREKGIVIPAPGGNELSHELDERLGLDRYVHLAFVFSHPMKLGAKTDGRIVKMVTLQIDRSVLEWDGVMFAPDVSNKAGINTYTLDAAVDGGMIDFDVLAWISTDRS
jgi:hypothetical protein